MKAPCWCPTLSPWPDRIYPSPWSKAGIWLRQIMEDDGWKQTFAAVPLWRGWDDNWNVVHLELTTQTDDSKWRHELFIAFIAEYEFLSQGEENRVWCVPSGAFEMVGNEHRSFKGIFWVQVKLSRQHLWHNVGYQKLFWLVPLFL